jgi:hypothetical protein
MKNSQLKPTVWGAIALTVYVTSYGVLRTSGQLLNIYNPLDPVGNGIKASVMEWRDITAKLAADKHVLLGAFEKARSVWPHVLEATYWPLRELEFAYWKSTNRYEDAVTK